MGEGVGCQSAFFNRGQIVRSGGMKLTLQKKRIPVCYRSATLPASRWLVQISSDSGLITPNKNGNFKLSRDLREIIVSYAVLIPKKHWICAGTHPKTHFTADALLCGGSPRA
jgi:hypothetical protein